MKTVVFFLKPDAKAKCYCPEGFLLSRLKF